MELYDKILTGYIAIPSEVDRNEYIKSCFDKESFSILTNDGGYISNVYCLKEVIGNLIFPNDSKELGSQVIVSYLSRYKTYIILGTLSKSNLSDYRKEGDLKLTKESKNTIIGISGTSLLGKLKIFINTLSSKIAELIISVTGNEDSKLSLSSSGWVCIQDGKGFKLIHSAKKKEDQKIIWVDDDKIIISNGEKQNLILKKDELIYGDSNKNKFTINKDGYSFGKINFEKYLTKILDFLGNDLVLNTAYGPTPPGCQTTSAGASLQQLKTELSQINI